jgi:hypothetical protein
MKQNKNETEEDKRACAAPLQTNRDRKLRRTLSAWHATHVLLQILELLRTAASFPRRPAQSNGVNLGALKSRQFCINQHCSPQRICFKLLIIEHNVTAGRMRGLARRLRINRTSSQCSLAGVTITEHGTWFDSVLRECQFHGRMNEIGVSESHEQVSDDHVASVSHILSSEDGERSIIMAPGSTSHITSSAASSRASNILDVYASPCCHQKLLWALPSIQQHNDASLIAQIWA